MIRKTATAVTILVGHVALADAIQSRRKGDRKTRSAHRYGGLERQRPLKRGIVETSGQDVLITITCDANDACTLVIAVVGGQIPIHSGANPKTASVVAKDITVGGPNVVIREGQTVRKLFSFQLIISRRPQALSQRHPQTGVTQTCVPTLISPSYLQKEGVAHFVVTPGGSILQYPEQAVDENDLVTVCVWGPVTQHCRSRRGSENIRDAHNRRAQRGRRRRNTIAL